MEVQKAPESELIRHDKIKLEVDNDFPVRTDDGSPPAYSEEALGSKVSMGGEPIFGGKMKPLLQAPEPMEETFVPSRRENSVQQSCPFRKLHEAKTRKVSGNWFKLTCSCSWSRHLSSNEDWCENHDVHVLDCECFSCRFWMFRLMCKLDTKNRSSPKLV